MQTSSKVTADVRMLQRETQKTEGISIHYALYYISTPNAGYYAVEIFSEGEPDMRMLGTDYNRAQRLFEVLVNETVTPCTLRDILHDAETEEDSRRYRQNLCKI